MVVGVAADGDERIVPELAELVPAEAELAANAWGVDTGALRQATDLGPHLGFVGHAAEPPIDSLKGILLGGIGRAIEAARRSVRRHLDRRALGDRALERDPPELAAAVGKARGDEYGERRAVPPEDRPGMVAVVAVAVIEGQRDEPARRVTLDD